MVLKNLYKVAEFKFSNYWIFHKHNMGKSSYKLYLSNKKLKIKLIFVFISIIILSEVFLDKNYYYTCLKINYCLNFLLKMFNLMVKSFSQWVINDCWLRAQALYNCIILWLNDWYWHRLLSITYLYNNTYFLCSLCVDSCII